ncbi:MAG: DUF4926 domain-containing protein [Ignavibacteria bacterium]|nr:DUF4926 domain-containing protein [Ignavibacteria bacterium]
MIKEFERIVLTEDLKDSSFIKGDVGTIVMIHQDNKMYEVEFFALNGSTLGVETVPANQIKSTNGIKKVIHIDELAV